MSLLQPFLAQEILPTDVIPGAWRLMGLTMKELLLLLGAVALVTLFIVLWAVYLRKRPGDRSHRHRHHHHHHSSAESDSLASTNNGDSDEANEKRYRRKRRRRREHRPRNPTLAETGGLPPLRPERPSDPLP